MLNKYGLSVVVCACFLFAACGGGDVGGDVTEDAGDEVAELDAVDDPGTVDSVVDAGLDNGDSANPADAVDEIPPADAVDATHVDVYQDTIENRMDTYFEGIGVECRPIDLGCESDEDCDDGLKCVACGCVSEVDTASYQFSPDVYRVATMVLPDSETPTGFDLNGDGVPDNKLAWAIDAFPEGTLRFNSILSDFVRTGVFNLMIELRGLPEDGCGPVSLALHPATSDIDLDGLPDGGDFQIRQDGFRSDGLGPVAQINSGAVDGNLLRSGPGVELPLKVPLTDGTVLTLPLEGFRVEMLIPGTPSDSAPRSTALALRDAPPDTNAMIGGYIRLSRVVDEINAQAKSCACAGVNPDLPVASFRVESGLATASCDQAIDTTPCDWSADGRFCTALDAVCLAVGMMATNMDVTSGVTRNNEEEAIPDALSLALYMNVTPSGLFDPPLAPDFAAVGDSWRMSPDCDVLQDDGPTRIGVLGNDHFLPSAPAEIMSIDTSDADGSVGIIAGGTQVVYTPNPGFWGYDVFSYTISDGNGNQSTAQVGMRVSPAIGYNPDIDLASFCALYCQQYELCYPDEFPSLYSGGVDECLSSCMAEFNNLWVGTSACTVARKQQEICRAALPCFRVPEFDIAMQVLAEGGETADYHCEDQVWARLDACGTCNPGFWGQDCAPCPTSDMNIPCDATGTCSDGSAGDGSCACFDGYENDLENGSCRPEDICYPDPCTMQNAIPDSCYPSWGQDQIETFGCSCENNTFWNSSTQTCFDWCNPNPCLTVPNSDGTCMAMSLEYYCGCNQNFWWDAQSKTCAAN